MLFIHILPLRVNIKKAAVKAVFFYVGRSDGIRTSDFYVPNVALYQAELHSVDFHIL